MHQVNFMKLQNDLELYTVDKQLEQTCNKLGKDFKESWINGGVSFRCFFFWGRDSI
jgi:hypothetical protein